MIKILYSFVALVIGGFASVATAQDFSDLLVGSCPTLIRNSAISLRATVRIGDNSYYLWDFGLDRGDSLGLLRISASDTMGQLLWFKLPAGLATTRAEPLFDFCLSKNRIAFLFWHRFLVYEQTRQGDYHLVADGVLQAHYKRIWLVKDTVYCSVCYYYLDGPSTRIAKSTIPADTADEYAFTPPPSGDIFSVIGPREPISISPNGLVAIAAIDKYNIQILNSSLDSITTLRRDTSDWHGTLFDSASFGMATPRDAAGRFAAKEVISKLVPIEHASRLIARVDFLDTATLLVTYSEPRNIERGIHKGWRVRKFDIWEKRGTTWVLSHHDMRDADPDSASPLTCASNNCILEAHFACSDDHIVRVLGIPILDVGKSFKQNQDDAEAYVKKHGPMCTLFDFTFVK